MKRSTFIAKRYKYVTYVSGMDPFLNGRRDWLGSVPCKLLS